MQINNKNRNKLRRKKTSLNEKKTSFENRMELIKYEWKSVVANDEENRSGSKD